MSTFLVRKRIVRVCVSAAAIRWPPGASPPGFGGKRCDLERRRVDSYIARQSLRNCSAQAEVSNKPPGRTLFFRRQRRCASSNRGVVASLCVDGAGVDLEKRRKRTERKRTEANRGEHKPDGKVFKVLPRKGRCQVATAQGAGYRPRHTEWSRSVAA